MSPRQGTAPCWCIFGERSSPFRENDDRITAQIQALPGAGSSQALSTLCPTWELSSQASKSMHSLRRTLKGCRSQVTAAGDWLRSERLCCCHWPEMPHYATRGYPQGPQRAPHSRREANYPRQHTLALVSLQHQSQHSQSLTAFKRGRVGLKELLRGPSHYGARDMNGRPLASHSTKI